MSRWLGLAPSYTRKAYLLEFVDVLVGIISDNASPSVTSSASNLKSQDMSNYLGWRVGFDRGDSCGDGSCPNLWSCRLRSQSSSTCCHCCFLALDVWPKSSHPILYLGSRNTLIPFRHSVTLWTPRPCGTWVAV